MVRRFRQSDIKRMSDDIPFDKKLDLAPDVVDEPMPGVRRIMANNPGPFTFKGTVSYIIGHGKVAIVDPGPDDEAHIGALLDAVRNETVTHIFVTHTHRDHSLAVPAIKAATGAMVYAEGPHRAARLLHIGEHNPLDASADRDFRPDVALKDGEVVAGDGWAVEAVATPGHTANHMVYALKEENALFAGDHVMAWATSIVAPPDGAMNETTWPPRQSSRSARKPSISPATDPPSPTPRASSIITFSIARRAKPLFCIACRRVRQISRPSSARSISALIRA